MNKKMMTKVALTIVSASLFAGYTNTAHASAKLDPGFSVVDRTKKAKFNKDHIKLDPGFSVVDRTKKAKTKKNHIKLDPGFSVVDRTKK